MLGLTPLPLPLPLPAPSHDRIAHSWTAVNRLFEWLRSPFRAEIIARQLVSAMQALISGLQYLVKHRESPSEGSPVGIGGIVGIVKPPSPLPPEPGKLPLLVPLPWSLVEVCVMTEVQPSQLASHPPKMALRRPLRCSKMKNVPGNCETVPQNCAVSGTGADGSRVYWIKTGGPCAVGGVLLSLSQRRLKIVISWLMCSGAV